MSSCIYQHHLLKRLSLTHCIAFSSVSKSNSYCQQGSIPGLYSVSFVCSSANTTCLDYCSYVVTFEIRKCKSSNSVLFHDCFSYSKSFVLLCDFKISLAISAEKPTGILIRIALNLCYQFGKYCHLKRVFFSHEHWITFCLSVSSLISFSNVL